MFWKEEKKLKLCDISVPFSSHFLEVAAYPLHVEFVCTIRVQLLDKHKKIFEETVMFK